VIAALAELISRGGYMGIVLLTFLETIFPPLPSELFMPMAGYVASRGTLSLSGVIAAGTLGSLAGAWFWYGVGRAIGLDRARQLASRYGRWLTVQLRDIDRSHAWFERHGGAVVLFGRMVPAIRSLISIPAGVAHMPLGRFLALTTLGTAIWTSVLMTAGFRLGADYGRIAIWAEPFSNIVVAALIGIYLVRLIRFRPD
jgi:membrane protein DedA with SNARE-associated domain